MSKSRSKVSDQVMESLATALVKAMEKGCLAWPLPQPPVFDADFPPIHPKDSRDLPEIALALLRADRGLFDRHLAITVDLIVPHRMNLTDDPFEVHERWLLRRLNILTERLLFSIATEWLAHALDNECPNSDKWWLAISLLNGLSDKPHGQPVHQGYHLVESIALGERPGTWHTQPEVTNANMDWNPHGMVPRTTSVTAHEGGSEAAIWMLTQLEQGDENRRLLLIEWCRLLLERKELIPALGIANILKRRSADPSAEVASRVVGCLARLIEGDREKGLGCVEILSKRTDIQVRRNMADVLTRLFRRIGEDAVDLLNVMLADEDESVLAAASATIGDLRFLDESMWADKILELCNHPNRIVKRNLVYTLRDYLSAFPADQRKIIPTLWAVGDEVLLTRLRELLIRMEEVDHDRFASTLIALKDLDLDNLWAPMLIRNEERTQEWKDWLYKNEDQPVAREQPTIHISDKTETEIPDLADALDTLDDMGFLD